ncbi:hypothetical protein DB347_09495 [Opitutaceae bacterium EW11]|nr:hypothetical protein DB347_09495 [Opitutaceae bacterium EW11]
MSDNIDYQANSDIDPTKPLSPGTVQLFQRFRQSADMETVERMWEAEVERHKKCCELAVLYYASIGYDWAELPRHPFRDLETHALGRLRESGFKIEARGETLVATWGNCLEPERAQLEAEWKRRETIEEHLRRTTVPAMQSRVEGGSLIAGEGAWAALLDNRHVSEVQRWLNQETLCVFDLAGKCIHHEETTVASGAVFGAEPDDITKWRARVEELVAAMNGHNE